MKKLFYLSVIFFLQISSSLADEGFSHGISAFGKLKYKKDFKHFDYVNPDAPKKGEIKFGSEGTFNSLNPFILKGIAASGISYIYDSLMSSSDDEISSQYPLIASGVRIAPDKSWIEFELNKKAKFHDGVNITADDVVFTFNKLISDGHPSYKMALRDLDKVEKINRHLVKFSFKNNKNRNLPLLIGSIEILPKHYFEKHDFNKSGFEIPLGSGAYKIKEVKAGKSITYERGRDYWAKDLPVNKGRYNFDKITFDYYRDNNVLIEAFKAQKYDFRQENIARNWANSYHIEAIKNGEIIKKEIPNSLQAPMQAFVLNLRKEKFQNLALRKAMTYAFDFEWLKKHIFYGSYERTESFFTNSKFGYKNFHLPKSEGDGFNRKNLLEAKKILEDAGFKIVGKKLVDKNGKQIDVEFLIDSKSFEMVVAPFVKNLQKLGINAKVRFAEENQYQTRVNNFDFDVVVGMFPNSLVPGSELFGYFHSSQKNIKGSRNLLGLDNKEVDAFVEKISNISDEKTLENLCRKLDKTLLENYYVIAQWHNNSYRILYRDIFEMPKKQPAYKLGLDNWWMK